MGFNDARKALIKALEGRNYQHDPRDVLNEKNLLAIGEVTEADVVQVLRRTRGDQYSNSPHDWDRHTLVHVFKPSWTERAGM